AIALNKLSRFVGCRFSIIQLFFFSSRRRHTRSKRDWSSDVCSSDLVLEPDYLPVYNSEESSSAPVMCFPANVDSEEYETLEWVDTSDDGVQFALYANGTIYNLSLKLVDWVGGQIITQRSVYAANYLSESNVVIVQVDAANSDAYMQPEYGS